MRIDTLRADAWRDGSPYGAQFVFAHATLQRLDGRRIAEHVIEDSGWVGTALFFGPR
jgi:hypothetical protein